MEAASGSDPEPPLPVADEQPSLGLGDLTLSAADDVDTDLQDEGGVEFRTVLLWRTFQDKLVEAKYQRWHHRLWMPRVRIMLILSSSVYLFVLLFQVISPGSLKFLLMEMRPNIRQPLLATTFIARIFPLICAACFIIPRTSRYVTPERYHYIVAFVFVAPTFLEQAYLVFSPEIFQEADLSAPTEKAKQTFAAWSADPTNLARQSFWNAILSDFYFICLGTLSGLKPPLVLVAGLVCTALTQLMFQNTLASLDALKTNPDGSPWEHNAAGIRPLWYYRLLILLVTLVVSVLLDVGQRQEFRVRLLLKRQKDLRIEQLKQEKERNDWDMRLALAKAQSPPPQNDKGPSSQTDTCTEIEDALPHPQAAIDSRPSIPPSAVSVPVKTTEGLNWQEQRRLNSLRSALRRPRSHGSASSSAARSSQPDSESSLYVGQTCAVRENALLRTLRSSGLVVRRAAPSLGPSAESSIDATDGT